MSNGNKRSESVLRFGDELFFYDQNNDVLVAENPLDTRACVRPKVTHFLSSEHALSTCIFRVEPQQTHTARRELDLFIGDDRDFESICCEATPEELEELKSLQLKANKERAQNEAERRRLLGKPVLYGQVVQLFNKHFKKYLTVTGKTKAASNTNHHLLQVNLSAECVGYFRIMPRYRIRFVGDAINVSETVALQCVRPEGYLNVDYNTSSAIRNQLHDNYYEVYSHTRISSWTMRLHYSSVSDQDTKTIKYTNSGQYVRFYHQEMESYLEAPATLIRNEVVLKKHIINPLDPKETDSPLAFWEIENVDISRGSKVRWKKSVRIRHVASRAYLSIDPGQVRIDVTSGKTTFTLKLVKNPPCTIDPSQDTTIFQLVPITSPPTSGIPFGSYVRIQHVLTECWMHAANGEEKMEEIKQTTPLNQPPSFSFTSFAAAKIPVVIPQTANLSPSLSLKTRRENTPQLSISQAMSDNHSRYSSLSTLIDDADNTDQQLFSDNENENVQHRITASQELYYHDCFSITSVDAELSDTFNMANEMLPQLYWYLYQIRGVEEKNPYPIHDFEYESVVSILKALIKFCTKSKENDVLKRQGLPNEYHQTLLRDIGIVQAIIQMIVVPFDLSKRKQVRERLKKSGSFDKEGSEILKTNVAEEQVGTLVEGRLLTILKLCYNFLRVFLIERSEFEDSNSISKENREYVSNVLGESGISLFIQHVSHGIGATDVLIKLMKDTNDKEKPKYVVSFLHSLMDTAVLQTKLMADTLKINDARENLSPNCLRLISALSDDVIFSRKIAESLFDVDGGKCLIKIGVNKQKQLKVMLNKDEWLDFDKLLRNPSCVIFLDHLLELMYSLSISTYTTNIEVISKCISRDMCFYCMKKTGLPSNIRSRFCDILRAVYVESKEFSAIPLSDYTIDFEILPRNLIAKCDWYSLGYPVVYSEFFKMVIKWILRFLDARHNEYTEKLHEVRFLGSVLQLVYAQLKLGFFNQSKDISILFRALTHILDGRTDARNEEHYKYISDEHAPREWQERYLLTEENQQVMNSKIQILNIINLIFDLRLHVRITYIATIWYLQITNGDYTAPSTSDFELSTLLDVFQETELRHRENSLIPIMKDILKYQYAPLKQVAVVVMHRLFNDSQELFKHIPKVVVLDKKTSNHITVYHHIKKNLNLINYYAHQNVAKNDDSYKEHLSRISQAVKSLESSISKAIPLENNNFRNDVDLDESASQQIFCTILKNLDTKEYMKNTLTSLLNIPADHYHDCINTIQDCLKLLCTISKSDRKFQSSFVLENMDLLINLSLLSPKIAHTFAQLCSNNLYISTHIKEEHLIRIISSSEGYQGDYLLILHDLLKTQGKLIKQNQDIVMRFMMENSSEYIPFSNTNMMERLKGMDEESNNYYTNLISVLAICGQGENTFGQSFARTIFSIGDIYNIVHDEAVSLSLKAVMLKFLASIYIEDVELPLDMPLNDNYNVMQLMVIAKDAMIQCLNKQDHSLPKSFHYYVYHGISAFLRSVYEYHISIESTIIDNEKVDFYNEIVDLALQLLPRSYDDGKALQAMLTCLDSMINVAGFRGSMEPNALFTLLEEATLLLDDFYSRTRNRRSSYTSTIEDSIPMQDMLNSNFQNFFKKIQTNTQLAQYQKIEFEKLCSHFDLRDAEGRESIKSLISYLSTITTAQADKKYEHYQVATIQLLENVVAQYIDERANVDPNVDPVTYDELEAKKTSAQNTLNDLGCTLVAQNLLSSPRRKLFDMALKLLISLLEGGNKNVQDKLEDYFLSISEERFFYSFHQRLQDGIAISKDSFVYLTRRLYKMNRQQYMQDNIMLSHEQQQSNRKRKAQQQRRSRSLMIGSSSDIPASIVSKRSSQSSSSNSVNIDKADIVNEDAARIYRDISKLMISNSESTSELGTSTKDYRVMEDTMRTIQLMVEGHNLSLQTYLAKQPDNIKSFNIVLDVVEYFHAIVPLCNPNNIQLIIQVLDTITELAQGCLKNQVTIFNNKIINPVNVILKESYKECSYELVNELKSKAVICLLSLLEGGVENSEVIYREMIDSLDLAAVKINMENIYNENLANLDDKDVYDKLECGFLYCILVMTLTEAFEEDQNMMFLENNDAFKYFQSHTGQIEIVMDYGLEKQLTRVLFPIPEVCQYLREETKQKFLWNVNRESPSSKIEDFVQQSDMIIYEIENQAHVAHSKYLSFLTDYSAFWWESAYIISILLNVLLMVYPSLLLNDDNAIKISALLARYSLSFIHLVLWILLTAEFYYIQLPVLVNRRLQETSGNDSPPLFTFVLRNFKSSTFLWATITETRLIYHALMLMFSILGLFYNPGFYSVHLLDFVFRDSVLQGVISSITLNIHSISRTAILGIIVIYIHSIIAYMYFRKEFDDTKGLFCGTLMECFVTVLSHGVRSGGGIGDILEPDELHKPSGWRTTFEMSFYLVVVVFLLNAIFGIIFDTFGHLRDERSSIQQDMVNSCFICSIPAVEFQRRAKKGFKNHVKNDHNIWQYLFFLVHLRNKDPTEYTGPESYVASCIKDADYSFFPINRALNLDKEEDDKERLDKLEELNQSLLEKLVKLEEHIDKLNSYQSRSRQNSFMLSPL